MPDQHYCVYGHTVGGQEAGATDEQIKEAITAAALVRKMSAELNGNQYDMAEFKRQVDAAYSQFPRLIGDIIAGHLFYCFVGYSDPKLPT